MRIFSELVLFLSLSHLGISTNIEKTYLYSDWCKLTCGEEKLKNIACTTAGKCAISKPCKLDAINKNDIVDKHNDLRNAFAAGAEEFEGHIQVSNMMAIQWDDSLAYTAQCNLAKCTGMEHDNCHTTFRFPKHVGQNIWTYGVGTMGGNCINEAMSGLQQWYDEIKKASEEEIKINAISYQASTHSLVHFTQLIWAVTTHVGCALTKNEADGVTICVMTCNYGPGGNIQGGSMFRLGKPCSECPAGKPCGEDFKSLCGSVKRSATERTNIDTEIIFVLGLSIGFVFMQ